eukprot:TRINITY_DN689_c1_g1_i5.p1 TRINITY_DN689_c1_g1~~TRINITY_DN689_c1_g1_i5.p1  ORF type:complete len:260 (-),score=37.87 TRINITY_DN689_c1_g1_i5:207-986(-)
MFVEEWFGNLPIITKSYMTACILTTLAVHLDLITILMLYLNFGLVYDGFEIWRLVTNFMYFGTFGLGYIFHMIFLVRHSSNLEESSYRGRTSDFLFLYLFGASCLLFVDWLCWYFRWLSSTPLFLGPSLAMMIVYVWSRQNPNVRMSFLGFFTFNAPYLPWVILGIEFVLQQNWSVFDIMGILVGHIYYFLTHVYPALTGRHLLKTPSFLKHLFDQPQAQQVQQDVDGVQNDRHVGGDDQQQQQQQQQRDVDPEPIHAH